MYCRCEGIVSWPLIRPCSSVLTGCLKSLISHQCLAHVHLLGGHIYFFVLFFVITARLVMVKQVRIVAPGNLRKIEYFKTQSFYDLMFFLHPKNKFFWKLPPGWRLSETFFFKCCMSGQAETGGFCEKQSQVPASKIVVLPALAHVTQRNRGGLGGFCHSWKQLIYLMRDRWTFLRSSATEEQALSAFPNIPSDYHSQVKYHIPSTMSKATGFVSTSSLWLFLLLLYR